MGVKNLHGKNYRSSKNFLGENLEALLILKVLAVWQAVCSKSGVQNFRQPKAKAQVSQGIHSVAQAVTSGLVESRLSSQSQYQATADSNGNHTRNALVVPRGTQGGTTEYGVLPYTHSGCETDESRAEGCSSVGAVLSGIASAWMAYTILIWPMEGQMA